MKRAIRWRLEAEWGQNREAADADALEDIAGYSRALAETEPDGCAVDEATWNDLDMDRVFGLLNRAESCVGEEALYAMLRRTDASDEVLARRETRVACIAANEEARTRIRLALRRVGKNRHHGACAYLFHPDGRHPAHGGVYLALALLTPAFLALGFVWPACFALCLAVFAANLVVYYRTGKTWMAEIAAVRHIASVLRAARALCAACPDEMRPETETLRALCAEMRPVARWNALFAMQRQSDMDFITDYVRIAFLLDMNCLTRLSAFFSAHNAALRALYALVGELDACVAIASYRASGATWTRPVFSAEKRVEAMGLAHPLLPKPVRNDVSWERCALITGSNASGKSTFVKALAVNAILAQSVVTCAATSFRMPRARVMTSMALRDDLMGAESYFVVEIRSLRRILDALREDRLMLCFIDEILRGTNTVERIAASSALLRHLAGENALCMAATHDRELTELLTGYWQLHFREEMTPEGMTFSYKLMPGASDTRNAIELLARMGFPEDVVLEARRAAARFDETRLWA